MPLASPSMEIEKMKTVMFVEIKSRAAEELEIYSAPNVGSVKPRILILKTFATGELMIFFEGKFKICFPLIL